MRKLFLLAPALVLAAVATDHANATFSPPVQILDATAEPLGASGACGWCQTCLGGHNMNAAGDKDYHDCIPTTCGEHASCMTALDQEVVHLAWNYSVSGDAERLRGLLTKYPDHFRFNPDRLSLQVEQCGTLVGNFPIAEEHAALLAD